MNWRIPQTNINFISGYSYHKICQWSFCPRYPQNIELDKLKEGDLVFLNLDYFEHLLNLLNQHSFDKKFILVTQNSDRDFTEKMYNSIEKFTCRIFAINSTVKNQKITKIPIGFNDHSTEILDCEDLTFTKKQNLVYLNFKAHHHSERPKCFEYFNQFNWVDVENRVLPVKNFYDKLRTFKYCVSPRGTGIDTHRLYESLLYGVIPIAKSSELDDLYDKLPILIVENWSDVTFDYLVDNYEKNLSNYFDWIKNNPDWYKPNHWINKI